MLDAVSQSALCKTTALSCVTFSLLWNYRKEEVKTAKRTLYLTCFFIIKSMHMPRYETSKFLPLKSQTVRQTQHHLNKRCTFELHPSDPHGKQKPFKTDQAFLLAQGFSSKVASDWLRLSYANIPTSHFLHSFFLEKTCESN